MTYSPYIINHRSYINPSMMIIYLNRRIDNVGTIERETHAWQEYINNKEAKMDWQFTADDARIKLKRLYPTIGD
jgi:hypothetical protein